MINPSEKKSSSLVKSTVYVIVTGVLVTVLGQWATESIWPQATPTADLESLIKQSPVTLTRWHDMTLQLHQAPEHVRKRLFDDFRGEQVVWVGYFDQFNNHSKPGNHPSPNAAISLIMYDSLTSLNSDQPLGPPFVRCFFSAAQLASIAELKRGQKIVVRGTLANPVLMGTVLATDLDKCELLAAEDDAERLAVLPGVHVR